jgi:hypothetical protein
MENRIEYLSHIVSTEPNDFYEKTKDTISKITTQGLDVEIQYQTMNTAVDYAYTALLIGRKKL